MTSNPYVPPFIGYVKTTVDALRVVHATQQGIIPRITRRLNDSERTTMIKSGAVFVFCVEESQIKRWTDGLLWSQSRILGNFLVYREIDERTTSRGHKKPYPHDDSPTRSLTGESSPYQASLGFRTRGGSDQGTFKTGGLIKKTITVIVQESGPEPAHLHLISYYTSEDIRSGKLKRPSTRADIMNLYMPPQIFRLTTFRVPPMIEIGTDGKRRLVEGEDPEPVDCEVEGSECSSPASLPCSSRDSLTSPVDNPFHGSSRHPLSSGRTTSASSNVFASRGAPNERWPGSNDGMLSVIQRQRQEMSCSPPTWPVLSSGHTMSRMQDNAVQSIHSQSGLGLPIANGFNCLSLGTTSDTVGTDRSKPLTSSIECSLPDASPADATGESRKHAVLQGTISALKHNQQIVGLARIPGLQSLVGVVAAVLNILEVVNNNYANDEPLGMLAQKAGLFVLTLVGVVEQASVSSFSDPVSMNLVIERLAEEMNWVLGVLNKFQISFISQKDITRIDAKLIKALEILQESNQRTTTAQRTF